MAWPLQAEAAPQQVQQGAVAVSNAKDWQRVVHQTGRVTAQAQLPERTLKILSAAGRSICRSMMPCCLLYGV